MTDMHRNHEMPQARHDHHAMMVADFKKRLVVSLIITIPILILSPVIQEWSGISIRFRGDSYVLFSFSSAVFFYGGYPFLTGLFDEVKSKKPGMMTLVATAITTAYVYSSAVVFGLTGEVFSGSLLP